MLGIPALAWKAIGAAAVVAALWWLHSAIWNAGYDAAMEKVKAAQEAQAARTRAQVTKEFTARLEKEKARNDALQKGLSEIAGAGDSCSVSPAVARAIERLRDAAGGGED